MAKSDAGATKRTPRGNPRGKVPKSAPVATQAAAKGGVDPRTKRYAPAEQCRLWDAVILELEDGKTLNKSLAAVEGSPTAAEFLRWAKESELREKQYAASRLLGYGKMADQIVDLSDECRLGRKTTVRSDGTSESVSDDMIARSRLQVDTRKWLLARALPKLYGDRTVIATESGDTLVAALAALAARLPV